MILKRRNVEVEATGKEEIEKLRAEGFEPLFIALEEEEEKAGTRALTELSEKELREMAAVQGLKPSKALRAQDLIDILENTNDRREENGTVNKAEKAGRQNRRGRTVITTDR